MIDFRNPYTPGAGVTPRYLAGRDDIINRAALQMEAVQEGYQTRSVVYYGLRGVGKTVILNKLEEIADNRGFLKKHIEVKEASNFIAALSYACGGFVKNLSLKENIADKAGKLWAVLRSFNATWNPDDNTFKFEMNDHMSEPAMAGTGDFANDFTELLVTLGTYAKQSGTAICFLIDEIQYAKESELEAMITATHRISQLGLPIIFFCAGLPKILKVMGDAKSYTERLYEFVKIDSLSREDAIHAIKVPASELGVSFSDDAIDRILAITNGYPYFIQEVCGAIWDVCDSRNIDIDSVKQSEQEANKRLDSGFFQVRYDRCTAKEKEFIIAMAKCEHLPCEISNVAAIMERSVQSISIYRSKLINKGLIYATGRGMLDFTVPNFEDFINRAVL